MGKALYRKYRSKRLSEIVGQSHITDILMQSLKNDHISHAYLLTGPRGVGKTSIARILAHEINGLPYTEPITHLDIIEIDAASNNGVEDIRTLREKAQVAPVSAKRKIYIIDEVHMLSKAAFNALLKTLEEPPQHIVFILATTDADKLPATIVSRTQQFTFRPIKTNDAAAHLATIAKSENVTIDDDALALLAERGGGSFRDSISLLDQLRSHDNGSAITRSDVELALGLASNELIAQLLTAYDQKNLQAIVTLLDTADTEGMSPTVIADQLINEARKQALKKPHYITLLDQLLDVGRSLQPAIKLLTVLAANASDKPKTVALAAPAPVVSAAPETLLVKKPASTESKPAPKPEVKIALQEEPTRPPKKKSNNVPSSPINWEALLEFTKSNYIAMYSVLSKCSYVQDGDTLTLYTSNAFYKKKLDDSKYRLNLAQALAETGAGELVIETIPTGKPPQDTTAAAVAAIMGGGVEVDINETQQA